ncbi:MAG TPA: tetratricopeptide repeat protein, partial [Methanobacterium sp.]|nr:tetratricopeptide repeat protein [Methanobacterium sp.]
IKPHLDDLKSGDSEAKDKAILDITQTDKKGINHLADIPQPVPPTDDEKVKPVPQKEAKTSSEPSARSELKNRSLYHYIERFVDKSRYDYRENLVRKTGYNYQQSDLEKLKKLLEYKGLNIGDIELQKIIQEEIKKQDYQEFEEKIMESEPSNKEKFLEIYSQNYFQDTDDSLEHLEKLLKKHKKPVNNLEEEVREIRQKREIKEFENKLLQPSVESSTGKSSPSIVLKFIKKELVEKRDKLISTDNYHIIEDFVHSAKYSYQIQDLEKLKKLLETKNVTFQDEELLWIIREEIKNQDYHEFEEKIMETHPSTKQHYLEQYIKNYYPDTDINIKNLRNLLQKNKITSINLENEVKEARANKEVRDFEQRIFHNEDSPYESLPVIESSVTKDRALKNAQILTNLGNLFYDLGKNDEALNYYDKALVDYPEYIEAWKNKGLIFYTMGRTQKAANSFYHVLNIDGTFGEVWLDIGLIFSDMGRVHESKLCYEKALHIQPGNLAEISGYTKRFLHKNPYYQERFMKFLSSVSKDEPEKETENSEAVNKILQILNQ